MGGNGRQIAGARKNLGRGERKLESRKGKKGIRVQERKKKELGDRFRGKELPINLIGTNHLSILLLPTQTTYLQLFMAITSYHNLLLHKVYNSNNFEFDHYSNIALISYTANL